MMQKTHKLEQHVVQLSFEKTDTHQSIWRKLPAIRLATVAPSRAVRAADRRRARWGRWRGWTHAGRLWLAEPRPSETRLRQWLPLENLTQISLQQLLCVCFTQPAQKQLIHLQLEHWLQSHGCQKAQQLQTWHQLISIHQHSSTLNLSFCMEWAWNDIGTRVQGGNGGRKMITIKWLTKYLVNTRNAAYMNTSEGIQTRMSTHGPCKIPANWPPNQVNNVKIKYCIFNGNIYYQAVLLPKSAMSWWHAVKSRFLEVHGTQVSTSTNRPTRGMGGIENLS